MAENLLVNTDYADDSGSGADKYPGWTTSGPAPYTSGSGKLQASLTSDGYVAAPAGDAAWTEGEPGASVTATASAVTADRVRIQVGKSYSPDSEDILAETAGSLNSDALDITGDVPDGYDGSTPIVVVFTATGDSFSPGLINISPDAALTESESEPGGDGGGGGDGGPWSDWTPPEHDPWNTEDIAVQKLAERTAAWVARPGEQETEAQARAVLPVVLEYVRGYTRGHGFDEDDAKLPARPLCAVIIAATARAMNNPEQVIEYSAGDYSERPARLTGWTLAERGILRRYRKVSA